jgi:hypothetical protein
VNGDQVLQVGGYVLTAHTPKTFFQDVAKSGILFLQEVFVQSVNTNGGGLVAYLVVNGLYMKLGMKKSLDSFLVIWQNNFR